MPAFPRTQWARAIASHGRNTAILLGGGAGGEIWKELKTRVSSSTEFVVLCRDLGIPFATPSARLALRLRPFQAGDERPLLDVPEGDVGGPDLRARLSRRRLLQHGIGTPFVAVTEDDRPVFIQWLFLPPDAEALRAFSGGFFPALAPDEALIEGLFTIEQARGKGVMAWAQSEVACLARERGARRVVMFVAADNVASLKGSARAGFLPCGRQYERWSLCRRTITREAIPELNESVPAHESVQ